MDIVPDPIPVVLVASDKPLPVARLRHLLTLHHQVERDAVRLFAEFADDQFFVDGAIRVATWPMPDLLCIDIERGADARRVYTYNVRRSDLEELSPGEWVRRLHTLRLDVDAECVRRAAAQDTAEDEAFRRLAGEPFADLDDADLYAAVRS